MSAQKSVNYTPRQFRKPWRQRKTRLAARFLAQRKQSALQAGAHEFLAFLDLQPLVLGVGIARLHLPCCTDEAAGVAGVAGVVGVAAAAAGAFAAASDFST